MSERQAIHSIEKVIISRIYAKRRLKGLRDKYHADNYDSQEIFEMTILEIDSRSTAAPVINAILPI